MPNLFAPLLISLALGVSDSSGLIEMASPSQAPAGTQTAAQDQAAESNAQAAQDTMQDFVITRGRSDPGNPASPAPLMQNRSIPRAAAAVPGRPAQQSGRRALKSIQDAIEDAGIGGSVVIPTTYTGAEKFSNPNGISVIDLRRGPLAYRDTVSVMDFGAKCDGVSDDTDAFVAADAFLYRNGQDSVGGTITTPTGKSCAILHATTTLPLPADDGRFGSGDNCGGKPCTILAPENAYTMKVGFVLHRNNTLACMGVPPNSGAILGPWDRAYVPAYTGTLATDQAALNDPRALIPIEIQGGFGTAIRGCGIRNAFIGITGPPMYKGLANAQFSNVWFLNDGIAMIANFLDSVDFEHVVFEYETHAGIVSGGWYAQRHTGYDGGYAQKLTIKDVRVQGVPNTLDAVSTSIDSFFDNYFWKSRNTPGCSYNTAGLSPSTCQRPGVDPATGAYTGRMVDTNALNPQQVFRGISGSWIDLINRNSMYVNNNTIIDGFQSLGGARWDAQLFDAVGLVFRNFVKENSNGHGARNDPYNPGVLEAAIRATSNSNNPNCQAMNSSYGTWTPYAGSGQLRLQDFASATGSGWPQAIFGDACIEWDDGAPGKSGVWPINFHPWAAKTTALTSADNSFPTFLTAYNGYGGNTANARGTAQYFLGSPGSGVGPVKGGWLRGGVLTSDHKIFGLQLGATATDDGASSPTVPPALQIDNQGVMIGSTGAHITGSAGNGGLLQQTTPGAKRSGDCVQFDANGNTVDAGVVCSSSAGSITTVSSSVTMTPNTHYVANGNTRVVFTIPASTAIGDTFTVTGIGAGGFAIAPSPGQTLYAGANRVGKGGCTGAFSSAHAYDSYTWQTVAPNAISFVGGSGSPAAGGGPNCQALDDTGRIGGGDRSGR